MRIKRVLALMLVLSPPAWANLSFDDGAFPELITSGRALAMGNAYNAKVDDAHSVWYNPAGLGTYRGWHFHLTNVHVETNKGFLDMAGGGDVKEASGHISKSYSLDGARELLLQDKGKLSYARLHAFPNISARYVSLGYMASKQVRATVTDTTNPQFEYADRFDHGPAMAMCIPFFGGIFKVGATGMYLNRSEAIGSQVASQKVDLQDSDYDKGRGYFFIGGARLTLPAEFLPTIAATLHNAANSRFTQTGGAEAPDKMAQNLVLAASITPQIGAQTRVHLEVDYKDATSNTGIASARRFNAGLEFDFARAMFVRFGYGDGYGSAGIGIKSKRLEVDLTTYAVDTTSATFQGKEDRRFAFSLSSGF